MTGIDFGEVCGAEVYPLCDVDAGWQCARLSHGPEIDHRDIDGTTWPVGELGPLFEG